jgi:hypothetical protein
LRVCGTSRLRIRRRVGAIPSIARRLQVITAVPSAAAACIAHHVFAPIGGRNIAGLRPMICSMMVFVSRICRSQ